jgi:uncharacterized protein
MSQILGPRWDRVPTPLRAWLLLALLAGAGCAREDPLAEPIEIDFGAGTVWLETAADTFTLAVEVAETAEQRRVGLMRRTSLPEDSGMIFLFEEEQPADGVFWMYNTLIPLSIAFLGPDGVIGSIRDMEPCTSPYPQWCPNYAAGVPFDAALEVNRGYFERRGVGVGDRVVLRRH